MASDEWLVRIRDIALMEKAFWRKLAKRIPQFFFLHSQCVTANFPAD